MAAPPKKLIALLLDSREFPVSEGGERAGISLPRNNNCHQRQHVGFSRGRSHLLGSGQNE